MNVNVMPRLVALGAATLIALLSVAAAVAPSMAPEGHDGAITRWIDPLRLDAGAAMRAATDGDRALRSYLLSGREDARYEAQRSATGGTLNQLRKDARMADPDSAQLAESFARRVDSWLEFADELSRKTKAEGRDAGRLALDAGVGADRLDQARASFETLEKQLATLRDERARQADEAAGRRPLYNGAGLSLAVLAGGLAVWLAVRGSRTLRLEVPQTGAARLRAVLEPLAEGVVVYGADGAPVAANEAARRILASADGGAPALLRGEGEPLPGAESPVTLALAGERVPDRQLYVESPEGHLASVTVRAAPIADGARVAGAVLSLRDHNEQERHAADLGAAMARAAEAEERLAAAADARALAEAAAAEAREAAATAAARAAALEEAARGGEAGVGELAAAAASVGLAVFDAREFRLLEANDRGLALFGETRDAAEARGAALSEIVPGAEAGGLASIFRQVAVGGRPYVAEEQKVEGLAHGSAWWRFSVSALPGAGAAPARLLLAGVDLTPFVEARREVASAKSEVAAEHSHRVEDVLVAVSNNLRTPVTSIQGMVGIFRDKYCEGIPDVTALHFLELTRRNADQMAALVEDMAELSALGRSPLSFADVPLAAAVEEGWQAGARDGLELKIAGPLPIVRADRARLARAFKDVFDVAGMLRADGAPSFVHVRARDLGSRWEVEIKDNGKGFDARSAESLFGPLAGFEDGRGANGAGPVLGVGIGLAAARRIAQLHGGDATASGEPGAGGTYSITIEK